MTTTMFPPHIIPDAKVFGDPQLHTDGDLAALAFAPDGSLWSVEEPGVVRHWHARTGQALAWHCPSDLDTLWVFSADARVLASASDEVSLWDTASGNVLASLPQSSWVTALAFQLDANFLVTGHDDGSIRFWDVAAGRLLREFKLHRRPVSALAFSADGQWLASAAEDKTIAVWDAAEGKLWGQCLGHTDRIPALAWHPRGDSFVSAGWDTTARVWDVRSCEPIILLNSHAMQVSCLAFSNDGRLLATADSDDAVHIWDFATRKRLHVLATPAREIRAMAFSADGERLAFGGGDQLVHIWDPRQARPHSGSQARAYTRTSLSLSPDGTRLATNGGGAAPAVWSISERLPLFSLPAKEVVQAIACSPDGKWIAGGCRKVIRLWNAADGRAGPVLDGQEEPTTALAWSHDAALLASASSSGTAVWLWNTAEAEPVLLIPDALDGCTVESLSFHPRGRLLAVAGIDWLATGGSDGAISIWDLQERCEIAMFDSGSTAMAFDPTGTRLACAALDGTIIFWDVESREVLKEQPAHDGLAAALAWSRDGRFLATGGDDRTVRLWDGSTGEELAMRELDTRVQALHFSPDGRQLYTANGNTTCYQFEVERWLE